MWPSFKVLRIFCSYSLPSIGAFYIFLSWTILFFECSEELAGIFFFIKNYTLATLAAHLYLKLLNSISQRKTTEIQNIIMNKVNQKIEGGLTSSIFDAY